MTDHLPECECYTKVHAHKCALCICDRLRACEQRVLDAAREAVVNADPYWKVETDEDESVFVMEVTSALAAIDALQEKP